jgi:TonB family protein
MAKILSFLLCICSLHALAQMDSLKAIEEISAFQKKHNEEFKDRQQSPLEPDEFVKFESHDFFPIDLDYRVEAKLDVAEGTPFFPMKTTTSRISTERVYGFVIFTLDGEEFSLPVYQSKDLMATKEYADYLFFPFTDDTNGTETYGGGRYIDLRIPKEGNKLVIDFNMAYNPSCAYSPRFSCPIVPGENQMDIEVLAGVRYHQKGLSGLSQIAKDDPRIVRGVKPEVQPEYPGGYEAMGQFIKKNMTYPRAAVKKKIHGVVYVAFIVGPDGSISEISTIRGISKECDAEAMRVVSLMPKWKPGQTDGKNVSVRFVLPLKFAGRPGW